MIYQSNVDVIPPLLVPCRCQFGDGKCGPVLEELYAQLTGLQMGQIEDKLGWTVQIA